MIKEKVTNLEQVLAAFIRNTDRAISSLSKEMKEFKDEMKDFKKQTDKTISSLSKEMKDFKDEMKDFKKQTDKTISSLSKEMKDFKDEMKDFKDEMKDFKDEMKDFKDEMKDFKDEMKDFKDEMKDFKDEMKDFKDEMKDFKDEMKGFKDEMKEFKDEMKEFKDETRLTFKNANKQWGELANKMGTVVEDIIAPGVRPVIKKYFDEDIIDFSVNRRKKAFGSQGEFDVVAVSDTSVYLVETKTTAREVYLDDFEKNILKFKKLFPEYKTLKLIPIFAGLRFEKEYIQKATKKGFFILAYREWEYLDILNFEDLQK